MITNLGQATQEDRRWAAICDALYESL